VVWIATQLNPTTQRRDPKQEAGNVRANETTRNNETAKRPIQFLNFALIFLYRTTDKE
jgi:hypothetical protein